MATSQEISGNSMAGPVSSWPRVINLTQANLFDAIRQRRNFARSSSYLSAMYTVNGQPMGSILPGMGPFELNLQATYAIPAGITATPRNICNWGSPLPHIPHPFGTS